MQNKVKSGKQATSYAGWTLRYLWSHLAKPLRNALVGIFAVALLSFAILIGRGAYYGLDDAGLIPHSAETSVTFDDEWMTNETKQCLSFLADGVEARLDGLGQHLYRIEGTNKAFHALPVKYWGRITRSDGTVHEGLPWKCQRTSDGLTCKAE